ncbi:unnamed protein product [Cuscuta campestris]|uniref:Uncharacterized protein n=1 Tax=Cuscuta campestris TaxID=132261 RepID=A0A484N8X1_9ASTE|nr:unnamed protein product [Cuscuta campestris]
MQKKLQLPNSGIEIGKLSSKNLDWKTIGISGQIPSSSAKKAVLKNDYKLVLELVIACLECGSGGHVDDINQERAFIINALITRTKENSAKHFFNSISNHLGKRKQKYLCQGLYLGYILESMGVASEGKKYDARYWLYYLSSKGENRASSTAGDEGSSDNVLIVSLKKSSKRKLVVSPSPSAEAPQNLALVNLDEEEEVPAHGELQKKKKRRISSPSTSGNANLDELLYYDWRAWKVGNSADQLIEWDQQLKNEKVIKRCLGLPINHCCEQFLDDNWIDMEATAEDFQIFPETSPAFETVLPEAVQEDANSPLQEQNQEISNEELQQLLQSQVLEILTTPCEISKSTELEIREKSNENMEKSTPPETNEARQEDSAVEVQRSFAEAEGEGQIARLEASEPPVTILEQQAEDEVRDSLSREISNYANKETEEESVKTLKIDQEEVEQGDDVESLPLQLFHRVPSSKQQSNPQNSIQHLSNTECDGTEAIGTIVSYFTNDAQTEERYNNLKRIQEECGVMQGIGEIAESSKRKKK